MDIQQAIDHLREQGMVCFDRVTDNRIAGGERFEHLETSILT
jgi:hypothetical protein